MRTIVTYPNPVLRKKSKAIETVDEKLKQELIELKEVLENSPNGAGLAAPQIGINKRFFGVKIGKDKQVQVLINPEILGVYGQKDWIKIKGEVVEGEDRVKDEDFLEGCLSFPEMFGTVKRWLKIKVRWAEEVDGRLMACEKDVSGFEAIVFQHELDHLNGILLIDHINEEGGKLFKQVGKNLEEADKSKYKF